MSAGKILRKLKRAVLRDEAGYHDMFENSGERYFARFYLEAIREALPAGPENGFARLLDAGCQAGRLAVPLARAGFSVTGVDTSDLALRRLKRHARQAGASVRAVRADLGAWLPRQPEGAYGAVLCAEVLYQRKNHRTLLGQLVRVLKPGGLAFISHRPPAFYLVEALERGDREAARTVLQGGEGVLWGSYYNWQNDAELRRLYGALGMALLSIRPIGLYSWLALNPEELDETQRQELFRIESGLRHRGPGWSRYLLVVARKQAP